MVAIACGNDHSVALKGNGTVVAWGDNYYGQTNVPAGLADVVAIAAGAYHCVALKRDGTFVLWGDNQLAQSLPPTGLKGLVATAAGGSHTLALKTDGTVTAWGLNWHGQSAVPAGLSNVVAIAAGDEHSLVLKADGSVVARGSDYYGQRKVPANLSNAVAVAAGRRHSLALRSDGTVAAWGDSLYGATNVPAGLSNVVATAGGGGHSLALKADGTVRAWGNNRSGQTNVPPDLTNVAAIAAGLSNSLALKAEGTVVAWGDNSRSQTNVPPGLNHVVAIAGGGYHGLALKNDGTIVGWGDNSSGQTNVPENIGFALGVTAGWDQSLALFTSPPLATCPPDSVVECGQPVALRAQVAEPDGDELTAVWWVNGMALQTNTVPAGSSPTQTNVTLSVELPLGTNRIALTVTDVYGATATGFTTVTVVDKTPPTIICPADIMVTNAHSAWTSIVTFNPSVSDNCSGVGLPICNPASGSAFGLGTHLVACSVLDAAGNSNRCSFHVTVRPGNQPPVPVIRVIPLARCLGWSDDRWCRHGPPPVSPPTRCPCRTNLIVIASNARDATMVCDGSKSHDPDDAAFGYGWFNGTKRFSTNRVALTVLPLGTNDITLFVDDTFPLGTNSALVRVVVLSPAQAVGLLVNLVENSSLSSRQQRSLLATLNAAAAAFERGNLSSGLNQLEAFQNKIRAQVARSDPDLAKALIRAAQHIIDALRCCGPNRHGGEVRSLTRHHGGKVRLQISGPACQVHLLQASTNLVDWETLSVAEDQGDGAFDFEDSDAARFPNRFYRVISP